MISSFTDDYEFLSNFYPSVVKYDGIAYPTVEHAFQAAKTKDPQERRSIASAKYPGQAKKLGRTVTMRKGWDQHKADVMLKLLRQKFQAPDLRKQLALANTTVANLRDALGICHAAMERHDNNAPMDDHPAGTCLVDFEAEREIAVKALVIGTTTTMSNHENDYEGHSCTCTDKCDVPCKGKCGCEACRLSYADFLSSE